MADEKVVYNNAPPVASDFKIKQNSDGSWDVINNNTGIYEGNYNTQVAAQTYTDKKVAGASEKASQAAAQSVDTGGKTDSNTTVPNTTNAGNPTDTTNSATTTTNTNGDPNPNAIITPPTEDQPSNLKVANVDVTPSEPKLSTTTTSQPQQTPSGKDDWRVRLSLANKADYLYKDPNIDTSNVLFPLVETNGVIFPYSPEISVSYKANYSPVDITHTNYKNYFYMNSSVDEISIIGQFTAQDNIEAKYMLAVIYFFKSVTKMFYGQDINPPGGTPPPLCFLTGLGSYQFENHPLVITSFTYKLPNDVDYVRADTSTAFSAGGIPVRQPNQTAKKSNIFTNFLSSHRLGGSNLNKQAKPAQPSFQSITVGENSITYVPTKLQIQLGCLPMVSRNNISNKFKLNGKDGYGSGMLNTKGFW